MIVDLPESCTVDAIKIEVEKLMHKYDVKSVFIDYMNIIQNSGGEFSLNWESQIETSVMLKQKIARYFQVGTWSANQIGGASDGKERLTRKDIAFAKNISDNTDVNCYITETEDTEKLGKLHGGFLKTRDFKGHTFTLHDNRKFMRFSNFMPFVGIKEKKQIMAKTEQGVKV